MMLKEFADEDMENLEVNIEGTEEFTSEPEAEIDDSYTVEEVEPEQEEDFESFQIEGLQEDLVLDDFNDEH